MIKKEGEGEGEREREGHTSLPSTLVSLNCLPSRVVMRVSAGLRLFLALRIALAGTITGLSI